MQHTTAGPPGTRRMDMTRYQIKCDESARIVEIRDEDGFHDSDLDEELEKLGEECGVEYSAENFSRFSIRNLS